MKIKFTVATKWANTKETFIMDTEELGYSDEEWDNMSEELREEELLQEAYSAIGFSFNYDYVD